MRFRPVTSNTAEENAAPAPFRSSKSLSSPLSHKKRGRKFPLKVLSPNRTTDADNVDAPSSEHQRSAKRMKATVAPSTPAKLIHYPSDVAVPSRSAIKALYEKAMENPGSNQAKALDGTGILSLEDVLIPAVMQQQVDAVKKTQARVQRDARGFVPALQGCRRALYETAQVGIEAAREARVVREREQAKADAIRAEERRLAREEAAKLKQEAAKRRREERLQKKAADKEQRKHDMKRKLPRNVELWREVALLMTELSKLQKEERLWKEADQTLADREKELMLREEQKAKAWEAELAMDHKDDNKEHEFQEYVNQAMQDITLSSIRVEQAVQLVSNLMAETDAMHQELARKYREDHQFHGYRGVDNPKSLIRALTVE
jgi:hypothetical protein